MRAEVRSLLEHHSRAGSFLAQPVAEAAPHLLEDDHTLEPGTVLGSYTVVREIGRGGMGRVYLASDARLGRTVALKALPPQLTREPAHRERLRREARAAAVLTHPGICTVYALEEFDGELYIATEFVEGHTLRDEIGAGRRPSLDAIVATARELASALASAHAKGITHRDLKPENVMRTQDGRIKMLDFGLARVEAVPGGIGATVTASLPGGIAGTPAYMAPEQIEGRIAGPAADVFAFGVLMYEWISGRHPFQAGSPLATLARVLDSTPEPLSKIAQVPAWLSDVIERCHAKAGQRALRLGSRTGAGVRSSRDSSQRSAPLNSRWWRTHQAVAIVSLHRLPWLMPGRSRNGCASRPSPARAGVVGVRRDGYCRIGRWHHPRPSRLHRCHEPAASGERARAHKPRAAVHRRAAWPLLLDGRRAAAGVAGPLTRC